MNDNEFIAARAKELIEKGTAVVLATIVNLEGSSPRHIGAKMLIAADGKPYGTIGGSLLEAQVIKEARSLLPGGRSKFLDFAFSGKDAYAVGMICGGKARVLLDYLPSDRTSLEFLINWQEALNQGKNFFLLTQLKEDTLSIKILGHYILLKDGVFNGPHPTSLPDFEKTKFEIHNMNSTELISAGDTRIVVDCIRKLKSVYIFGAGHVASPTSHLAAMVGFRVIVLDDRLEYASTERFPEASEVRVIEDFKRALNVLEVDADSFIVIVTRGHQYDREVLEQALKTKAGYIGMISSRRKREAIYNALMAGGVTKEQLDKVHSPIGIDIGGETPEEIAVSIVAELISERVKQMQV